jgi:hypothetical protein
MEAHMKVLLAAVLITTACVGPDTDADDEGTAVPKLASNSLMPSQIVYGSKLNTVALSSSSINSLAQTANGRTFLYYVVGCALASNQSVSTTVGITNYTWYGDSGLTTYWTSHALSASDTRWVSACVLARTNYYGQLVTISMRGSNTNLASTSDELTNYNAEEAAYFGDIFNYSRSNGCEGSDQATYPTYSGFQYRICGVTDPNHTGQTYCTFNNASSCSTACASYTGHGGYYYGCTGELGNVYNEVITIVDLGTAM